MAMHTVTIENWEEYAILRADGELDAAGQMVLEAFLGAHPELAEEAQLYDVTRLVPDETVVFAGKENLLKPESRVIRLDTRRVMWAVAAGVALLIGAAALLRNGERKALIAGGAIASHVKLTAVTSPASAPQHLTHAIPAVEKGTEPIVAAPARSSIARRASSHTPVAPVPSTALPQRFTVVPIEGMTLLSVADLRLLAVDVPNQQAGRSTDAELPAATTPAGDAQKVRSGLLARLTPDSDRLQLVDDLRATAFERITDLRSTREKLRNADVTVSVGTRELFTLHF